VPHPTPSRDADAAATARAAVRLSRGITATWWYTAGGIVFLELVLVLVWITGVLDVGRGTGAIAVVGLGGLVWVAATVSLLVDYRNAVDLPTAVRSRRAVVPVIAAAGYGVAAGLVTGLWMLGVVPLLTAAVLLTWPPGVRRRIAIGATLVIAALWFIDSRTTLTPGDGSWWLVGFYSTSLPILALLSMWWWDVLVAVDRARASEGRLAATQERLRVATDVHDLQGHHLQVIALQLELAERLIDTDPSAALEQLRLARSSVDEARQGTRDLATRFRSVPLRDELANAADLLRAAGTSAEVVADPDADSAPARVLGPVIRETTTNVLRHGGGAWARLSLTRTGSTWRFETSNDAIGGEARPMTGGPRGEPREERREERRQGDGGGGGAGGPDDGGGAGLPGIERRVAEAGGTVEVRRGRSSFALVVTIPVVEESP
jgi:two-component system sensor histidine kinase DesK